MYRINCLIAALLLAVLSLSSCSKVPETAKYIPSDAMFVAGVNIKELGKEIAWSSIAGSDIIDKLKKRGKDAKQAEAIRDLDKSGIKAMSSVYFYMKHDKRFPDNTRHTILLPLDDAAKWEAFVKKNMPEATITQQKDYKEVIVNRDLIAGWNRDIVILMNAIRKEQDFSALYDNTGNYDEAAMQDAFNRMMNPESDTVQTRAELAAAFSITKDNSLLKNPHFTKVEKENHDISFWVNYDALMNKTMDMENNPAAGMSSLLWKDNELTAGIDFEKGKITGDMTYYSSEMLKQVFQEIGSSNVDKEMIARARGQNLGLIAALNMSSKAVKKMMDKTGMTGIANTALKEQELTVDDILNAFTGDMVFTVNDFSMKKGGGDTTSPFYEFERERYKPDANMLYVMKIGKKEAFSKLLRFAVSNNILRSGGNNTYRISGEESPMVVVHDDRYAVFSNREPEARSWLKGGDRSKLPAAASDAVNGHQAGFYVDVQYFLNEVRTSSGGYGDSVLLAEGRKLVSYISMHTGAFKNDHYTAHLEIAFQDKSENSLLQLINFGLTINDARQKEKDEWQQNLMTDSVTAVVPAPVTQDSKTGSRF